MKHCDVDGCEGAFYAKGFCTKHYQRLRRHGSPTTLIMAPKGAPIAFVEAVVAGEAATEPGGCVLWPFSVDDNGYPHMQHPTTGRTVRVGALVLERTMGPRPSSGHTVGHAPHLVCGSRACIAPAHLSWQTRAEQSVHQWRVDRTGVARAGFANPQATVTDAQVAEAVARCAAGESQVAVAADLGVNPSAIWTWVHGRRRASALAEAK